MRQGDEVSVRHERGAAAEHHVEERYVEATLAALRAVQPRPGLEQRVLRGVRTKAETAGAGAYGRRWPALQDGQRWRPLFTTAVLAAGLAVGLAAGVAAFLHRDSRVPEGALQGRKAGPAQQDLAALAIEQRAGELRARVGEDPAHHTYRGPLRQARLRTGDTRSVPLATREQQATGREDRGRADKRNMPAPEEPLTEQERLLQRLARGHAPQQLVAITGPAQHAQEVAEQREYAAFFAPAFRTVEEIEAMQRERKQ